MNGAKYSIKTHHLSFVSFTRLNQLFSEDTPHLLFTSQRRFTCTIALTMESLNPSLILFFFQHIYVSSRRTRPYSMQGLPRKL